MNIRLLHAFFKKPALRASGKVGVHGVKKLTPPPLLTFNVCLKYLLGLLPRTKNADPRLLGVKKQPPRLLILLALKPCWFMVSSKRLTVCSKSFLTVSLFNEENYTEYVYK